MPKAPWFQPIRTFLRKRGWDIVRTETINPYHLREYYLDAFRLETIKNGGITLVLDIGAAKGEYAAMLRKEGFQGRIACFEPQSAQARAIESRFSGDEMIRVFGCAVGSSESTLDIHISENKDSSSMLKVSSISTDAEPMTRQTQRESVRVRTLDAMKSELFRPGDKVWMKVDVQGFENEVLSGARESLQDVSFVEMELSVAPVYEGQPLIGEMIGAMREYGFELAILGNPWSSPKDGQILQMDGVFRKRR